MSTPQIQQPTILVIVGITGDLAKRKLIPSIIAMKKAGVLPEHFALVGTTRQADQNKDTLFADIVAIETIIDQIDVFSMDVTILDEYDRLSQELYRLEKGFGQSAQRLLYLSVPPTVSRTIISDLGMSGIARMPNTKLLVEKPFGTDLASAQELIEHIAQYFTPEQVYRIDHYLAKDMVQDILTSQIDTTAITHIAITASERIGIEGRTTFYEQTGALLDLVQSHLLQFVAVTLMDTTTEPLPVRRCTALSQVQAEPSTVVRGQYQGYTTEVRNAHSSIETFVSLTLHSTDPWFIGVPIVVTTGKALDQKQTEIRITYGDHAVVYADQHTAPTHAYERVLTHAMQSNHDIFVSNAELLECWRIIAPIQEQWKKESDDLQIYPAGSSIGDIV